MEFKRILIKLSGQALAGDKGSCFCMDKVGKVCAEIKKVSESDVQIALVVGAGNIWRGRLTNEMNPAAADNMGMLATSINALMLEDTLRRMGVNAEAFSAVEMNKFARLYKTNEVVDFMEQGGVAVFAAGTGNPFFTTDTAAALRALEIGADCILLAKSVDGVYDSDPGKNPDAKKYKTINYADVLAKELRVMDITATAMCKDGDMPVMVFELDGEGSILNALNGKSEGTYVARDVKTEYY